MYTRPIIALCFATIVLLSLVAGASLDLDIQHDRDKRQSSSDQQIISPTLTLVTNSPLNCSTGLTHSGVFVMVEYRLVEGRTVGEWQLLDTVTMEPTENGCNEMVVVLNGVEISHNRIIQLRIVQLEHGGGPCNCWGVKKLALNSTNTTFNSVLLNHAKTNPCDLRSHTNATGSTNCPVMFCGSSASLPRGVVYPPVNLTGHTQNCPSGSTVVDVRGPPPMTNCSSEEPRIQLFFILDLQCSRISNGDPIDTYFEGIEVSMGNWDRDSHWIPLHFFPAGNNDDQIRVPFGPININDSTVVIRGYDVPYTFQNSNHSLSVNWSVCGEMFVRDGLQFRWLQTTSVDQRQITRDCVTMDDLSISLAHKDQTTVSLVSEDFRNGTLVSSVSLRNSEVKEGLLSFGTICTTFGCCDLCGVMLFVSRIATTKALMLSTPNGAVEQFEATVRKELAAVTMNISKAVMNNDELLSIQQMPAEVAVESLVQLANNDTQADVTIIAYLLSDVLSTARDINNTEEFSQNVLKVVDGLIGNTITGSKPNIIAGSTLLSVTEQLALNVLTPESRDFSTSNIEVMVFEVDTEEEYFTGIDVRRSSIRVPTELMRVVGNGTRPVTVASVYYRNMTGLLPGTLPGGNDSILASPVLSTSLQCGERICDTVDIELNQPVFVILQHSPVVQTLAEYECVFWRFISVSGSPLVSGRWDTEGCVRNDSLSNSTHTVCECTHLTNFAILLSARPLDLPAGVALSLSVIGYIGVALSVAAMVATIVALAALKSLWSMRNFIHINLCVSLILAQLTFVIGVTPHEGGEGVGPGCRTAAVILHYLFLVTFMWMLMEGVVLYVGLVRVFVTKQRRYTFCFFIFSYGAPLLYMFLCVPLGFALYTESDYGYGYIQATNETTGTPSIVCWLNPYTHFVWTFIAPVLVVICVNVGFFIMTLVIVHRHAKTRSTTSEARYWLRSSVSLVTIMGLTWAVGILVFEVPVLYPLAYIFTIFVAFQGVAIFVLFVLLNKPVREAYSKWWKIKATKSEIYSRLFPNQSLTKDNGNTLSAHIGPTSQTASHSNTNKEFNLSKRNPALEVSALKFDTSTLSESAPDDSDPGDWVPSNTVRQPSNTVGQVSENEEQLSYHTN